MNEKIIVFCGAFNPPTMAHLHAAQLAKQTVHADRVVWVPSKTEYIKNVQHKTHVFGDGDRMDMLFKMLFGNTTYYFPGNEGMDISIIELGSNKQPKTYQTMDAIQKQYNSQNIFLLVGSDKLHEFSHWANIDYLLTKYKVIVVPRAGEDVQSLIRNDKFLSKYESSFIVCADVIPEKMISSTIARQRIQSIETELDQLKEILPRYVLKEIIKKMEEEL